MVDLVNILDHMRGKSVYCNGTVYLIDDHGIATGVADLDAEKMLSGAHWLPHGQEALATRLAQKKITREAFKKKLGGSVLLGKDNSPIASITPIAPIAPIAPKKIEAPQLVPRAEELPSMHPVVEASPVAPVAPDPGPVAPDPGPVAPVAPDPGPVAPVALVEVPGEPPILDLEAEWPDPHVAMKKSFLLDMADAYGLQPSPKATKPVLVDLVLKAMYDEV